MVDQSHFIPRLQSEKLQLALETMRVVILTGARQTGKTTLARRLGRDEDRTFITLDQPEMLDLANRDPEALWHGLDRITIDEVQRSPQLLNHLKIEVDNDLRKGRFLLTGSANLLLMESVSESLAGRAGYVSLPPLTLAEKLEAPGGGVLARLLATPDSASAFGLQTDFPAVDNLSLPGEVFEGGFPETHQLDSDRARDIWREGYVATYIERDLRNLSAISDLPDFLRLLRLAVLRTGQLINFDGLARDAGLSPTTARRWLNLLEVGCQAVKVPAFTRSRGQRLIKSPKLYPVDSGLACHLCGIGDTKDLCESPLLGSLFESYVLQNISAYADLMPTRSEILYWRTVRGHEVDFVIETADRLLPIEVKTSRVLGKNDLRGVTAFLKEYPEITPFAAVIYEGSDWYRPARDVIAIPWSALLAH